MKGWLLIKKKIMIPAPALASKFSGRAGKTLSPAPALFTRIPPVPLPNATQPLGAWRMFQSQLMHSFAEQQQKPKSTAELVSFGGGFGLKPVGELLMMEAHHRKLWTPSERSRVLSSLEKLRFIREAEVSRDALEGVLDKIKLKSLVMGEFAFRQGDTGREMCIVLSGQMQFCVPANKVRPTALNSSGTVTLNGPSPLLSSPQPIMVLPPRATHTTCPLHALHARTALHCTART